MYLQMYTKNDGLVVTKKLTYATDDFIHFVRLHN